MKKLISLIKPCCFASCQCVPLPRVYYVFFSVKLHISKGQLIRWVYPWKLRDLGRPERGVVLDGNLPWLVGEVDGLPQKSLGTACTPAGNPIPQPRGQRRKHHGQQGWHLEDTVEITAGRCPSVPVSHLAAPNSMCTAHVCPRPNTRPVCGPPQCS